MVNSSGRNSLRDQYDEAVFLEVYPFLASIRYVIAEGIALNFRLRRGYWKGIVTSSALF